MEAKNEDNLNQDSTEMNESIVPAEVVNTDEKTATEVTTENIEPLNDEIIIEIESVKKVSKKNNKVKMKDKKKTLKANEKEKAKAKKAKKAKKDKAKKVKVKAKIKEKKAKAKSKKSKKTKKNKKK